MKGDLLKSVKEILDGFHPGRLFIEATGVADPFEVKGILRSSQLKKHIGSIKIITVVNGDLWEGREYFGPLFYNQIKAAELIRGRGSVRATTSGVLVSSLRTMTEDDVIFFGIP